MHTTRPPSIGPRLGLLALAMLIVPALGLATTPTHGLAAAPGTVVAWGDNRYGQTNVPAGLSGVIAIAAGAYHSLTLKGNGTVVAWGCLWYRFYSSDYGQCSVPAGLSAVTAIAAGTDHSLALKGDGTVVA